MLSFQNDSFLRYLHWNIAWVSHPNHPWVPAHFLLEFSLSSPRFSFRHLNGKVSFWLLKKCSLQYGYFSHCLNFNFKSKISLGKKSISTLFYSVYNNGLQSEFPENEIRKRERRLMILYVRITCVCLCNPQATTSFVLHSDRRKISLDFYYRVIRQKIIPDTNARLLIMQRLFQARMKPDYHSNIWWLSYST